MFIPCNAKIQTGSHLEYLSPAGRSSFTCLCSPPPFPLAGGPLCCSCSGALSIIEESASLGLDISPDPGSKGWGQGGDQRVRTKGFGAAESVLTGHVLAGKGTGLGAGRFGFESRLQKLPSCVTCFVSRPLHSQYHPGPSARDTPSQEPLQTALLRDPSPDRAQRPQRLSSRAQATQLGGVEPHLGAGCAKRRKPSCAKINPHKTN